MKKKLLTFFLTLSLIFSFTFEVFGQASFANANVKTQKEKSLEKETLKAQKKSEKIGQEKDIIKTAVLQKNPMREPAAKKTFTVTKRPVGGEEETQVGEYDTFADAIENCSQSDLTNLYIITVNKDYDIPETEYCYAKTSSNILIKSAEGKTCTIKRLGTRCVFEASTNCKVRTENIIFDGHSDGEFTFLSKNGELTLGQGTVVQNFIDVPSADGPAIYMIDNSKLNIEKGALIQDNNSNTAGGVIQAYNGTTVNISGGTFKNNKSNTSDGGAIAAYGTLNITGGTFEGNEANKTGGAVLIGSRATASISNATFKDNKASTGGAVYSLNDFTVSDTTFENNEANWGGALFASKKITLNGSSFERNGAKKDGGAIYANNANNSVIEGCNFKNNSAPNEKAAKQGGAIYVTSSNSFSIKNNTFTKNAAQFGGALFVNNVEGTVEGNTFEENFAESFSSAFHVRNSAPVIKNNVYKNNGKKDDKTTVYATLMVESVIAGKELTIENDKFENNSASKAGGAIVVGEGTVNLKGCEFTSNKVPEYGGAIYITRNAKVNIEGSKFIGNTAKRGGAIVTEKFSQANPAEDGKYDNLKITDDVEFDKNFASDGYFNPPMNYDKFSDLKFKTTSLMGKLHAIRDDKKNYDKVDSLLNNYDVYYVNPLVTIIYDSNGGSPAEKIYGEELKSENDEITPAKHKVKTLKETGLTKNGFEFKEWNSQADGKGTAYKAGDEIKISSNQVLYAIWKKTTPKPPENVTLTLDENYLGGKITTKALKKCEEAGKNLYTPSRDGYVFLGWKYNKDGSGDWVKATDKICKDTSLYAIWEKIAPKPEPQPEPERRVHEHINTFPVFAQADSVKKVTEKASGTHIGYISGYPDNTVKADGNVTRAEAVTMVVRLKAYPLTEGEEIFKDVKANAWYAPFVNAAYKNGILEEKKGESFRPDEKITRAELAQLISHIDKENNARATFPDIYGHKYEAAINQSFGNNRISGYPDGTFKPDKTITRAETARILNSLFDRKVTEEGLAKVKDQVKNFIDLEKSHWAYYEIIEASCTHEYQKTFDNLLETWKIIIK